MKRLARSLDILFGTRGANDRVLSVNGSRHQLRFKPQTEVTCDSDGGENVLNLIGFQGIREVRVEKRVYWIFSATFCGIET